MPKIKLLTNVAEYGLFRGVARTRSRLIAGCAAMVALTYATGLWAADYMFDTSSSVVLNLLIITGMMMLLLVASYLLTLLIGDVFFPGPWREQVILGQEPHGDRVSVDDHSAEFLIVLLLAVIANTYALNMAADNFLDRYHNEGFYRVQLRADEPAERISALEDIIGPMNYELWDLPALQRTVVDAFDDPSPRVRQRAYWTAGYMQNLDAQDNLLAVIGGDLPAGDKRAAATALGKMGQPETARQPLENLARHADDPAVQVGALRGLGLLAEDQSVDTILPLVDSPNEQVMVHAFWALRKIGSTRARSRTRQIIDAHPRGQRRCAAYDTLKKVAVPDDAMWARREFQRLETTTDGEAAECNRLIWTDYDDHQYYIVYGDGFREKLMKIVANVAAFDHRQWFQRLVNDPSQSWRIREVADEVLREIKKAERQQ